MSELDNKDTQVQQEPQAQEEPKQPLIGGKFKSVDDLLKSYTHLEKRLHQETSKTALPDSDKKEPAADPDFKWKAENAKLDAQQSILESRKKAAADVLADDAVLGAVRRALGDSAAVAEFEKEFDAGEISAAEVRRLAKLGGFSAENTKTIPESKESVAEQANEAEIAYMMKMLKNSGSAYFNQKASDHKHVVAKVNEIKARIGV